nr:MAG TPA: hypothetical protein [Bacteriophage sp.]
MNITDTPEEAAWLSLPFFNALSRRDGGDAILALQCHFKTKS